MAVEELTTRTGAFLASKVVYITSALLGDLAFRLHGRGTSVWRYPSREYQDVGFLYEESGFRLVLLGRVRRVKGVRGEATSPVRLVRSRFLRFPSTSVYRGLLGL